MNSKNKNEEIVIIITDELGNEIIEGMEITIPADIASEYGAFEDDAHTLDIKVIEFVEVKNAKD